MDTGAVLPDFPRFLTMIRSHPNAPGHPPPQPNISAQSAAYTPEFDPSRYLPVPHHQRQDSGVTTPQSAIYFANPSLGRPQSDVFHGRRSQPCYSMLPPGLNRIEETNDFRTHAGNHGPPLYDRSAIQAFGPPSQEISRSYAGFGANSNECARCCSAYDRLHSIGDRLEDHLSKSPESGLSERMGKLEAQLSEVVGSLKHFRAESDSRLDNTNRTLGHLKTTVTSNLTELSRAIMYLRSHDIHNALTQGKQFIVHSLQSFLNICRDKMDNQTRKILELMEATRQKDLEIFTEKVKKDFVSAVKSCTEDKIKPHDESIVLSAIAEQNRYITTRFDLMSDRLDSVGATVNGFAKEFSNCLYNGGEISESSQADHRNKSQEPSAEKDDSEHQNKCAAFFSYTDIIVGVDCAPSGTTFATEYPSNRAGPEDRPNDGSVDRHQRSSPSKPADLQRVSKTVSFVDCESRGSQKHPSKSQLKRIRKQQRASKKTLDQVSHPDAKVSSTADYSGLGYAAPVKGPLGCTVSNIAETLGPMKSCESHNISGLNSGHAGVEFSVSKSMTGTEEKTVQSRKSESSQRSCKLSLGFPYDGISSAPTSIVNNTTGKLEVESKHGENSRTRECKAQLNGSMAGRKTSNGQAKTPTRKKEEFDAKKQGKKGSSNGKASHQSHIMLERKKRTKGSGSDEPAHGNEQGTKRRRLDLTRDNFIQEHKDKKRRGGD